MMFNVTVSTTNTQQYNKNIFNKEINDQWTINKQQEMWSIKRVCDLIENNSHYFFSDLKENQSLLATTKVTK